MVEADAPGQSGVSCPFCEAWYFKPILMDRSLRCTECGGVFKVLRALVAKPIGAPSEPLTAVSGRSTQRSRARLTSRQEDIRSRMTSKLNALAQTVAEETAGIGRVLPAVAPWCPGTSAPAYAPARPIAWLHRRGERPGLALTVRSRIFPAGAQWSGAESGRSRQRWWVGLLAVSLLAWPAIVYFWGPGPVGIALEGIVKAGDESAWRFPSGIRQSESASSPIRPTSRQ